MRQWWITGAGSGFGRAIAQAALGHGDRVIGSVRTPEAGARFEALQPGRAQAVLLDVGDELALRARLAALIQEQGVPDIVVNNAGYGLVAGVEDASSAEIRAQFEVNVFGAIAVMQAVLPGMRARGSGFIVNISSVSGLVGWPSLGLYSGSKFALEGISETLAQEVAEFGIRVMLVEPGGFRTDFAGRSRAVAATPAPGYAGSLLAQCKQTLVQHAGSERGDPARAAAAILAAVEAPEPPLRLLLGADAVAYALAKLGAQQAEIARWLEPSTATDFVQ